MCNLIKRPRFLYNLFNLKTNRALLKKYHEKYYGTLRRFKSYYIHVLEPTNQLKLDARLNTALILLFEFYSVRIDIELHFDVSHMKSKQFWGHLGYIGTNFHSTFGYERS